MFKTVAFTMYRVKDVSFNSDIVEGPACRMAVRLDSEGNPIVLHQLKAR